MPDPNEKLTQSFATYYDRDSVLKLARLLHIASWVVAGVYAFQLVVTVTVFVLQIIRHLIYIGGLTDFLQQLIWQFQPSLAGLIFFAALQAIGKGLLILMDIEDNTRRTARNK